MPFKTCKQEQWMRKNKPAMAKRWAKESGSKCKKKTFKRKKK